MGCRNIVHLGGPDALTRPGHTAATLRAAGTRDALLAASLDLATGGPLFGDWTETWGWQAVDSLLAQGVEFDGLVCANDQICRGAIDCLTARGLRVPEDVAAIGFDNWEPIAPLARLPQSSVDMNLSELGRAAARAVLEPGSFAAGEHLIAGTVIARASSTGT